jgi:hypothetical protein
MSRWVTLECERAHYVHRGDNVILCDRLPSPVTLVVKLASADTHPKGGDVQQAPLVSGAVPEGETPNA